MFLACRVAENTVVMITLSCKKVMRPCACIFRVQGFLCALRRYTEIVGLPAQEQISESNDVIRSKISRER